MTSSPKPLPQGWISVSFDEIGLINPKSIERELTDDDEITFVPMRCVYEMGSGMNVLNVKKFSEVRKGYTPFIDGDLLVAKITPCMENGKVVVAEKLKNGVGFGSTEFHTIRFQKEIEKKLYYFYFLRADIRKDAQRHMTGTAGQLRVPSTFIQNLKVPLPPLPEQHRIVTKIEELLTQLDAGVGSLRKVRAQLKRYRQAVLKAAFEGSLTQEWREEHKGEIKPIVLSKNKKEQISIDEKVQTKSVPLAPIEENEKENIPEQWSISRIGDAVRIIDYRGRTPPYSATGIPHLRSQNIKKGKIVWQNLAFVSDDTYNQYMTRGLPIRGDILFTTEAPLGEVALAPEQKFSIAQRIMLLRPFENVLVPKFLMYQIKSDFFQNQLTRKGTGTTVTGVSSRNFQPIIVKIPSLLEQNRIVDEIERIFSIADEIEQTVTTSLRQADSLRQSILKQAFEGKLVLQDPNDEPASILLERIKAEKARHAAVTKKGKTLQPRSPKRKIKNAN